MTPIDYGTYTPLSWDLADEAGLGEQPPEYEWKPRYRWYALAVDLLALAAVVAFVVEMCQK